MEERRSRTDRRITEPDATDSSDARSRTVGCERLLCATGLMMAVALATGCPGSPPDEPDDASSGDAVADTADGTRDTADADATDGDADGAGGMDVARDGTDGGGEVGTRDPISCDAPDAPEACDASRPKGTSSENCPSERYAGESHFDGSGICLPEQPELPRLDDWSCPDPWTSTPSFDTGATEGDALSELEPHSICEPPTLPDDCSPGHRMRLGYTECVAHGAPCPGRDQNWPSENALRVDAPNFTGDVVYVAEDASGGSGTRTDPYGSIDDALAAATSGSIVALGRGEFQTTVDLDQSVALVGACPGFTILRAPSGTSSGTPTVDVSGPGPATVAELRIAADGAAGAVVRDGIQGIVRFATVAINGAAPDGLAVGEASEVKADSLVVRDTRPGDAAGGGTGIRVETDGILSVDDGIVRGSQGVGVDMNGADEVDLTDVAILRSEDRGLFARAGTDLQATRLLVEENRSIGAALVGGETTASFDLTHIVGTEPGTSADDGLGIHVWDGAGLDASRLVLRGNHTTGLHVEDAQTEATLERALVAATEPWALEPAYSGEGVKVLDGASLTADGLFVDRNNTTSLVVDGASANLTDTAVTRTQKPRDNTQQLLGVVTRAGGALEGERFYVADHRSTGLRAEGAETTIGLTDTTLARTDVLEGSAVPVLGLGVMDGASLTASRLDLTGNVTGLHVEGDESSADLTDVSTTDSTLRDRGGQTTGGTGLTVKGGARLVGSRVQASRNPSANVLAAGLPGDDQFGPTEVEFTDLVVQGGGFGADELGPWGGTGLVLTNESTVLERALIEGVRKSGISAYSTGSVDMTDVVVTDMRPSTRQETGIGFGLYFGSREGGLAIEASRLAVRNALLGGIVLGARTSLTLSDARVVGTEATEAGGEYGEGLYFLTSPVAGNFTLERSVIRENARAGMIASGRGGRIADSLVTGNRVGLVRQGETDIEVTNSVVRGNRVENERCRRQCYEEPPEPKTVSP